MALTSLFSNIFTSGKSKSNAATSRCAFGFFDEGILYFRLSQQKEGEPEIIIEEFEFVSGEKGVHSILLKQIAKKYKTKKTPCYTYLDNQFYQVLVTEKPEVPDADIINALQWEIKDLLSRPIENTTLDTYCAPDTTTGKSNINVIAADKEKIADLATLFDDAKLKLAHIDIKELILRNIALLDNHEKNGIVSLWLTENHGKILFMHDGNLYLSRNIDKGYNAIANSSTGMEDIALEVQRSIDYFERHYNQVPVKKLLLMPLSVNTSVFCDFLNKNLSIKTHELKLQERISGIETLTKEEISQYLLTIGVAINPSLLHEKNGGSDAKN